MKRSILYFVRYFVFWFLFFVGFKIVFLLYNFESSVKLSWADLFGSIFWGFRMDLSVAGYLTLLPGLMMAFSPLFPLERVEKTIRKYTLSMLLLVTFLGILDFAMFPHWGCRLNGQILPYLGSPSDVISTITFPQLCFILGSELVIVWISYKAFKRFFPLVEVRRKPEPLQKIPILLVMTALLILPVRSSLSAKSLNFNSVCFSQNLFANQAACNYCWSFSYALLNENTNTNPVHYMDEQSALKLLTGVKELDQFEAPKYIHSSDNKPINVVLIVLESFSNRVIEPLGGLKGVCPRINGFCKEGLVFSSFYATGNRSDKGLSSIFASYPAVLRSSSVLLYPEKLKKLDLLPTYFAQHNYDLSFYYGGDLEFYNQKMLVTQSGIRKMVSNSSFPVGISSLQKWGAPDANVYDRAAQDLPAIKKPFFSVIYTLSSHEPFDVPNYDKIHGSSSLERYLNAVSYADHCLGDFMDELKKSPQWKNTLVIITADHTSRYPGPTTVDEPENYHIPMLWLGGVVDSVKVVDNICMQTDLMPTLIQQMGWKSKPTLFAKNIFGPRQYAFYYRDAGWGFLAPGIGFFDNLELQHKTIFYLKDAAHKDSLMRFANGFTQHLHDEFMKL